VTESPVLKKVREQFVDLEQNSSRNVDGDPPVKSPLSLYLLLSFCLSHTYYDTQRHTHLCMCVCVCVRERETCVCVNSKTHLFLLTSQIWVTRIYLSTARVRKRTGLDLNALNIRKKIPTHPLTLSHTHIQTCTQT